MKKNALLLFILFSNYSISAQCYTSVFSSDQTIIARKADDTLWARGDNQFACAGNGTTADVVELTQIGSDTNWSNNISISLSHVLAIKNDGTLWAWGTDVHGSCGIGVFATAPLVPIQVGTDSNWTFVTTGFSNSLAIKSDGTLWSWGSNNYGTLGINNLDDNYTTNVPIQIGTQTNWLKIYTGKANSCFAIKTDGTLWSWGNTNTLAYPNATINNAYRSPHQVGTDTWKTISVGDNIVFGIKTDDTLWSWGSSSACQFGNGVPIGTNFQSYFPMQIGVDANWKLISVNNSSAIALKTNGTRWGWGNNYGYNLGNSTDIPVLYPTQLDNTND